MSQVVVGTVARVVKKDTKGGTKYEVSFRENGDPGREQVWVTFELGLAERAFGMIDQGNATLTGEINKVKRGDREFTNYDLKELVLGGALPSSIPSETTQSSNGIPDESASDRERQALKESRIVRGNAVNAAGYALAGSGVGPVVFLAFAKEIEQFILGSPSVASERPTEASVDPEGAPEQDAEPKKVGIPY